MSKLKSPTVCCVSLMADLPQKPKLGFPVTGLEGATELKILLAIDQ